ncbi:APM1 Aminopeptidase, partial [Acromyrmex charruanus]
MNLAQISSSVIFITVITVLAGEYVFYSNPPRDFHLPLYIRPIHYQVNLIQLYTKTHNSSGEETLNTNDENSNFLFVGTSNVTINILRSTHNIRLHSLHPIINDDEVTLIRSDGKIYQMIEYTSEENIIDFTFDDVLTPELYTIKIQFFGELLKRYAQNFFEYSESNDEKDIIWLISPTIQSTGLGKLFPCWSEAHLKATFKMSINHHRNYTVLSNMPVEAHDITDRNVWWTYFHVTPPMSILQLAIVVTTFSRIRINENITLWCRKYSNEQSVNLELDLVKDLIKNITLHLMSEFSEINIPKMDHVAVPNFPYHVTSKWGLIFHREADLIYDKQIDTVMRKIQIARLIAPKIAYQWFSNVVSISWWSDFWLHDGLATLFGEEAIVKTFNKSKLMDFFLVQSQYDSLHLDSHYINMNPAKISSLSKIDSIFSFPRSMKVLVVLRMFQNVISTENFRENVHTYLWRHIFSSSFYETSPIHEILDWKIRNVSNEFLTWIENERYPVLIWKRETRTQGTLFQTYGDSYGKWWIPVTLYYPFRKINIQKVFLIPAQPIASVYIDDPNSWRIVNFESAGYFRVNYDNKTLSTIINIYQLPLYKSINVISRAKIIDDAFHFMIERQFNVTIFWNLTQHLSRDTDYVAWYPMIKIFEYMSTLIPFSVAEVKYINIKEKFWKLLDKPLRTLGFEEDLKEDDFTKYLRQEIVKWSCSFRYDKCIQTAHDKLKEHLKDLKKNR